MATRFYLPSSGAADVSPAFDTGWELTSGASRFKCVTTKISSALTSRSPTSSTTGGQDRLVEQWVSDPISADAAALLASTPGTVKGQMRTAESNADADARAQIIIRVVSNDGTTFRGTLLAMDAAALSSEFDVDGNPAGNRKFPRGGAVALSAVASTAEDDRIVIEPGSRWHASPASARALRFRYGDAAASDLPEDETTTDDLNPWVEFSVDMFDAAGGGGAGHQNMLLTGVG